MDGTLTFRDERSRGFDPVNGRVDLLSDALAYIWRRVGIDNAIDLLTCFLETL